VSITVLRDACIVVSSIAGSKDSCPGLWWTEAAISALPPGSEVAINDMLERQIDYEIMFGRERRCRTRRQVGNGSFVSTRVQMYMESTPLPICWPCFHCNAHGNKLR